jgi:hypothetical protein
VLKASPCLLTIITQITFAGYMKRWLTYALFLCLLLLKGQHFLAAFNHHSPGKTIVAGLQNKNHAGLNAIEEPDDILLYSIEENDDDDKQVKLKATSPGYLSACPIIPFHRNDLLTHLPFSSKPYLFPYKYIFHCLLRV